MDWFESQIETRARLDSRMNEQAYAELAAAIIDPHAKPNLASSDLEQADGAIHACLRYVGATPGEVSSAITDPKQRVDLLCQPSGTMHREVTLEEGWHTRATGAMLGILNTGEPVALLPRGVRGYSLLNPKTGKKVLVTRRVASALRREAVLFYKPLPTRKLTMPDLVRFVASSLTRNDYLLVLSASVAVTIMGLLPAWANSIAFGTVVPSGHANLIAPIAALLLGVTVSTALVGIYRNLVMARVSTKLNTSVEAATFARVLSLPTDFFASYSSGNLASRVSNMTILAQTLVMILLGSLLSAVLSLAYVIQIAFYAPVLAGPALSVVLLQALLTVLITFLNMRFDRLAMEASAKSSGMVTALLNGIQKIKLAGAEDRAFAKWAHGYAEYAKMTYNRPSVLRALPALIAFVGMMGTVQIYYLAGTSEVSVANYMAFNTAFGQATAAIMALANMSGQISQIPPMLEMIKPIMDAEPELSDDKPIIEKLAGGIEVSGVTFRYNDNGPYVLKDLSFNVQPGEYVALVGKSGCGKSTILRLLLGFERPERGAIFYGTHDVGKVDLRSLRSNIGVVMQNGRLFMGDIASNITISTPNATLEDAWNAAEIAGIADDIRKMPMGMQTLISEGGGGVSGGQRQRLMIARAVCSGRKILILDEATSALDNITQKHVSDSLDHLKCTRLVVAHRLSTVRNCDRILVVDDGHIAEEGTYDELLAKDGLFAALVARQRLDKDA